MTLTKYLDTVVLPNARYPRKGKLKGLPYLALALAGEAGEVANEVKKLVRDDLPLSDVVRDTLLLEVGDVLYYLVALIDELKSTPEEVMDMNRDKLEKRRLSGKSTG